MWNKVVIGVSIGLFFSLPAPLSAGLDEFNSKIIRTAFLNGYVRALSPDIETIRSLKENLDIMKRYAFLEVDQYLNEVQSLNEQGRREAKQVQGVEGQAYQSRGVW